MQSATKPPPLLRRSGFTLVEMVGSMVISTVLLGGIGAAVMLAGRAVPSRATTAGAVIEAEQAIARIASDLTVALAAPTRKPQEIEFTVADRNNDSNSERFGYKWSGVAGTPLRVSENLSVPVVLVPQAHEFSLEYLSASADSRFYLYGVRIRLRASADPSTAVETTILLLNAPEFVPVVEGTPDES